MSADRRDSGADSGGHGAFLVRGALGIGGLQVVSIGLQFATVVVLARALGEAGFGAYSYALTWALVLLGPATFGIGPIVTRETAAGVATGEGWRVRGVRRFALITTLCASSAVVLAGWAVVAVARPYLDPEQVPPLVIGMPVTALSAGALVARHALIGLRRPVIAQVAESVLRPALVLAVVGGAWGLGWPVDAAQAMMAYGAATVIGLGYLGWQIHRASGDLPAGSAAPPDAGDPGWLRSALPLLVTSVARDLNAEAGILVVGSVLGAGDVGLLRAATRFASMPTYLLTAVNLSFQPVAAALFAKGELARIEALGVRASRIAVALSLPVVGVCLVAGGPLLSLLGDGFVRAAPALAVLALGHLFNVACGSVGVILIACRREDDAARGLLLSCVVTVAANLGFGLAFGLNGAAAATALGLVIWNVALTWFCWKRLGIVPAAIPWPFPRKATP